jgi:allantoin racemase
MRIAVLGNGTARRELPAHFTELAGPNHQAWSAPIRLSAFARSAYERLIVDVGYVDAAQAAVAQGCDAVFINSFADYGIEAMRAALSVPVIGAGEATLRAALELGAKFAIVTVWPASMRFLYDERLKMLGIEPQCVGVLHVSAETELDKLGRADSVMERMHRGESPLVEQLAAVNAHAVHELGANVIVLGCTCMAPVGPTLAVRREVPVLESSRVGFVAALRAATGAPSPVPRAPAKRQLIDVVSAWTQSSTDPQPECEICEVVQ